LRTWSQNHPVGSQEHTALLQKELTQLRQQQDNILNLRLADEIDADAFATKKTELRDRIANTTLQIEVVDRDRGEQGELTLKNFEPSQALESKWFTAGFAEGRKLLELVFSTFRLDDVTLAYEINKPLDVLAKGLFVPSDRVSGGVFLKTNGSQARCASIPSVRMSTFSRASLLLGFGVRRGQI
jgi:hypothetical protein